MQKKELFLINEEIECQIEDITQEGMGVSHLHEGDVLLHGEFREILSSNDERMGFTVFISGGLPGDQVRCKIRRVRSRYIEAHLTKVLEKSEFHRNSPCPYAEFCDGCALITLDPEEQRAWKKKMIWDNLTRIGAADRNAQGSIPLYWTNELGYRNKINLRMDAEGRLGYTARGTHYISAVDACPAALPVLSDLIGKWNALAVQNSPFWASIFRSVRMVIFRANTQGQTMGILITDRMDEKRKEQIFEKLRPLSMDVLCLSENPRKGDIRLTKNITFATSKKSLPMQIHGLEFEVSPASFFQIHSKMAEKLYQHAIRFFSDLTQATVLDLYCGTGTTSLLMAQKAKLVIGVEMVSSAVEDAKKNAHRNHIHNVEFLCARAEDVVQSRISGANAVLVDPPRAGLDARVVDAILKSEIREVVYISCNPSTLARDVRRLNEGGFVLKRIEGFEMFPNTTHVESVVLLTRAT
ncbi:MAG: 23S rRNA (uracil(1939)-C(5))-methyltransferase RlmD [Peptoniphilaceae bacterium]|nr:23S rRNA (uracil(1939)-C(5))-methyltransferase RlmD [Peptoniphilaceae bacterium]MDY5841434.1 23S rRNA (uracil(1939)-C(5))-methyltransferase RlmD [Peptoniphilaceae bacterium]MDY6146299.1 23S rRNA (uracil(1939)-C(5))-methyltransferase RlmD [Peptoniphilaceae bacterium]